jgi:ATP-dependent Clp protease ATP-binding subunit ClpC
VFERFSDAAKGAIFCARAEAILVGSQVIDTQHLLVGLLRVDPVTFRLIAKPITLDSIRAATIRWHVPGARVPTSVDIPINTDVKLVFLNAVSVADGYKHSTIRSEHLLLGLMTVTESHAAMILEEADASRSQLEKLVSALPANQEQHSDPTWREGLDDFFGHAEAHIGPTT